MLATVTLSKQLEQFKQLAFHHDAALAEQLIAVQQWQKKRMLQRYSLLFEQHQLVANFLLNQLYSQDSLQMLASQLDKALHEKIKLDRFLPDAVLDAAISAFELAHLTLQLDEQVASYLLNQQPNHQQDQKDQQQDSQQDPQQNQQQSPKKQQLDNQTAFKAMQVLQQQSDRLQQLALLQKISKALHQYGHNFFIQSAFKLARRTAYRREFNALYDYLTQAFMAIRSTPANNTFFKQFITGEKQLLQCIYSAEQDQSLFDEIWQPNAL